MGILDRFRSQPQSEVEVLTKTPGFAITAFTANNPFTSLIQLEDNYFDQYILYTARCIEYNANKVASAEIHLYDTKDRIVDEKTDLFKDLQSFNPYQSLWDALWIKESHLDLTGAAFWYIDRKPQKNKKAEFYILDPTKVQLTTDKYGLPGAYSYLDADGKKVNLAKEDVIYFRRPNPQNWFEGLSKLKQILFWSNAYAQGAQYNMNKLGNNTNVDKLIFFDGISDETKNKLEEQLANKYRGPRNAGRTGIVNQEPKVIDVSSNPKDLDYVAGMTMLRQDILVSFGIPEAIFFPSATNSNTKEAVRLYQADTLEPLLQRQIAVFNEQLIPQYRDPKAQDGNVYFDFANVVDQDRNELVAQAAQLVNSGIFTRDQALEYIGAEPIGGELGGSYLNSISTQFGTQSEPIDEDQNDEIKSLKEKTSMLTERLTRLIDEREEEAFREKNLKMAEDQEGIMYASAENLFKGQFADTVAYLQKVEKPTIRGIFNYKEAVVETKQVFRTSYEKVMGNTNDAANIEIKAKLYSRGSAEFASYRSKSLSGEALNQIERRLSYFADVLNDTTQKKLRKLVAEGTQEGFDKTQFVVAVQDTFNGFIDGDANIEILQRNNLYIPTVEATIENGVVTSSGNRYNAMLERITAAEQAGVITKTEMNEALKALKGLIDPSDPVGKTVDNLLTSIYGIPKQEGISYSRAVTIARTEATYARNLGFDDTYTDNPFVKGKMWNAALDSATREAHGIAHGQVVPINESFRVGGENLNFPGDTSLGASAGNIVNCRCRITAEVID